MNTTDKAIEKKVIDIYEEVATMQITPNQARLKFMSLLEEWLLSSLKRAQEEERKRIISMLEEQKMIEIPPNIAIYEHQNYAYKAGHNNSLLQAIVKIEKLAEDKGERE